MTLERSINSILPENYRFLQNQIYNQVGIVIPENKQYLLESRLSPMVKQLGLANINELCSQLQQGGNDSSLRQLAEAMTTNETYFFRDPSHFDVIRSELLPRLREEHRALRKLRFWSAAASSGQEAYSLSMLLLEEKLDDWQIQILGTDFSSQILDRARRGLFHQIEVNRGLPARLLVKHFKRSGTDWELSEEVKRPVRFECFDLRKSMRHMGPFNLVFCRNVMIYFDDETKTQMIKELHSTLFRGGWLLLGGAEAAIGYEQYFEKKMLGKVVLYVAR